jgi:hypothetical protein
MPTFATVLNFKQLSWRYPNLDGYKKKCLAERLGVKYDSQATNKTGRTPCEPPLPQHTFAIFGIFLTVESSRFMEKKSEVKNSCYCPF